MLITTVWYPAENKLWEETNFDFADIHMLYLHKPLQQIKESHRWVGLCRWFIISSQTTRTCRKQRERERMKHSKEPQVGLEPSACCWGQSIYNWNTCSTNWATGRTQTQCSLKKRSLPFKCCSYSSYVFVLIFYNTRERSRLGLLVQRDLFWKHLCSQREIPKSLMSACTTHQLTPGVVLFGSQVRN